MEGTPKLPPSPMPPLQNGPGNFVAPSAPMQNVARPLPTPNGVQLPGGYSFIVGLCVQSPTLTFVRLLVRPTLVTPGTPAVNATPSGSRHPMGFPGGERYHPSPNFPVRIFSDVPTHGVGKLALPAASSSAHDAAAPAKDDLQHRVETEAANGGGQTLGKRKLADLVSQIHPNERFEPDTEQVSFRVGIKY